MRRGFRQTCVGWAQWRLALLALASVTATRAADFTYTANPGTPPTVTITGYSGSGAVVVVPATLGGKAVTAIGDRAFYYRTALTRVTLPGSVTSIGERAFYYCSGLTSMTIPNGVTSIGGRAFYHCSGLTSVMVGSGVTSIGAYAFGFCSGLTEAYFQGDAPSLGANAFEGSDEVIVYRPPAGAGWGATYGGRPTELWASPTVGGISPSHGLSAGGSRVAIAGTNLTAATAVRFGTVAAASFTVSSATQIVATSPPGIAGETVDVSVTTPGGSTANTAADDFTYNAIVVSEVSSPTPNGTYGPGAVIVIRLGFSEKVIVTGAPQLTLETGANDAVATYTGGSGSVALTFAYTVAVGELSADLDCAGTDALALQGGSIVNVGGHPAELTLPRPGGAHSLARNQALVVAPVGAPNGPFEARLQAADVAAGRGLWDLSGAYLLTVGAHELALDLVHDSRGKLTGVATLQVNTGKARVPVSMPVKGRARGSSGDLVVTLSLRGTDAAHTLSTVLILDLALNATTCRLGGQAAGSLTVGGASTAIAESVVLALPPPMDGTWSLVFELQPGARGIGGRARLALANGVVHDLAIQGRAAGAAAMLDLRGLPADPAAAAVHFRTTIATLGGALIGLGEFSGQAYGQALVWP